MTRIAFIGLGNMGGGMAANQAKAGHQVRAFDLSPDAIQRAVSAGCIAAATVRDAVEACLADFDTPRGVLMPAAVWIVQAVQPAS